ncbi:MAG: phosphotransferase family protein [Ilumatobacteraceae bacterium]
MPTGRRAPGRHRRRATRSPVRRRARATSSLVADGRQLILQRQRSGAERSMEHEAEILRAAHRAGVPVPEVVASSGDAAALGAPFLLVTAIEGETIARKLLRDEEFAEARRILPAQLGRAAAAIHRIDPAGIPGLEQHDQVAYYRQVLDDLGQPHPAFELAFRWLEEHRPASPRTTLVHGDFRLGNVMVGSDGLRAILDWELAHLGDPLEDLGWLCVRAWRFGGPKPVAGMGDYEELFDAYEAASGAAIDREAARWWEVLDAQMGDHVHPPGQQPPHRRGPQPRVGRDRTPRLRERVRPVPGLGGSW